MANAPIDTPASPLTRGAPGSLRHAHARREVRQRHAALPPRDADVGRTHPFKAPVGCLG